MNSSLGEPPSFRIIMVGTKDFALPTFERLLAQHFHVVALITQPDRPQGRKQEIRPSRMKSHALAHGIPVEQPENINDEAFLHRIESLRPDLLVTAAYGQILSSALLAIPRFGGINLHGSILPAYRGAAPVARAIQRGETHTGVTVIQMSPRIDAGGMLAFAETEINPNETAGALEARLASLGAPLVTSTLPTLFAGTAVAIPQDRSRVSRAPKLSKEDGRIDWSRPAREIHNQVRAMQPWPTAYTHWHAPDIERKLQVFIHRTEVANLSGELGTVIPRNRGELIVATGEGALQLLDVQIPGKRVLSAAEFLRGRTLDPTGRFLTMD